VGKNAAVDASEKLRGEYNVENLKLSRDRHENCKTHPIQF